jgi:hypothetical protein
MTDRGEIIMSGSLCLFFTIFVAAATTHAPEARLMPLAVGIPALLLSLLQLRHDIHTTSGKVITQQEATELAPVFKMLLWFAAAVLGTLALGILPAGWLFVLLYLRFQRGSGLVFALLVSSGFITGLYVLVTVLLDIELQNSVVLEFIRGI